MGCSLRDHCRPEECETCTPDKYADKEAELIEQAMLREEERVEAKACARQ